jgi:hypothetical protein
MQRRSDVRQSMALPYAALLRTQGWSVREHGQRMNHPPKIGARDKMRLQSPAQ